MVFAAHNAGRFWPARKFLKYPGTITFVISEPVDVSDKSSRELTEMARNWIEGKVQEMDLKN